MKVILDKYTMVYAESWDEYNAIHSILYTELRFKNPEYAENEEAGYTNMNADINEYFVLYAAYPNELLFTLPKSCNKTIGKIIQCGINVTFFRDDRVEGKPINFKAKFEPRDEQQAQSIDDFFKVKSGVGLLNALCG